MATNDKRDDLFDINLGGEMIEIPDETSAPAASQDSEKNKVKQVKTDEGVTINDDGSFEIESFIEEQKEIEQQESDDEDDDNETLIDKTEEKNKSKKTPSDGGSSDSSPSSSPYLAFAKDRANEGVFLDFTEEDWKELVERNEGDEAAALRELHGLSMSEIIRSEVERYKESLTPEERLLYEAKEKGLPVDKYSIAKRNFSKYSSIKPDELSENESMQEELVRRHLELRGFAKEEIEEEIEGYKALDNLEVKAKKALDFVPKAYKKEIEELETSAAAQEEAKKDAIRQRVAKMKSVIDNTPEIIPGIKLNKQAKEKIMESMTVPVAKDKNGNPLNPVMATRSKNPEGFEMLIHYYHQLGLFNIDESGKIAPDFSKISKIESKKAVDSLRSAFESKENVSVGKPVKPKTESDEMDEFDRAFRRL